MVAEEMYSVGLPNAIGKPLRGATGISWGIIPLVEEITKEYRQVRFFAANSSLDPSEVVCLVNVRDDDDLLAGVHAWVVGGLPGGRKLETTMNKPCNVRPIFGRRSRTECKKIRWARAMRL
jgi:hypothetical protein